jgi:hypothetical protein
MNSIFVTFAPHSAQKSFHALCKNQSWFAIVQTCPERAANGCSMSQLHFRVPAAINSKAIANASTIPAASDLLWLDFTFHLYFIYTIHRHLNTAFIAVVS